MKAQVLRGAGCALLLLLTLPTCRQSTVTLAFSVTPPPPAPAVDKPLLAVPIASSKASAVAAHHRIGQPLVTGNLTVFPVYADRQDKLGRFTTLDEALEAKTAVVREVRGRPRATRVNPGHNPVFNNDNRAHDPNAFNTDNRAQVNNVQRGGARVNRLVIENRGDLPLLVLAGTVVKGGKQDRQVAQDFVVGPKKQVDVETFCVERGRWNSQRAGKSTGGRFTTVGSLANLQVRNAAQHRSNQSLVWQNVAETNRDNAVKAKSGTLMATLDDRELRAARKKLLARISAQLAAAPQPHRIVGLAYAVDGKVRSVRWFFNRTVFQKFKKTLLTTAALESQTAAARAKRKGAKSKAQATVQHVVEFIQSFANYRQKRKETSGSNDNYYRKNPQGYQATTVLKSKGIANPISVDFSAK